MQNINQDIRKVFYKHFSSATIPESELKLFIEELGTLVQEVIQKTKDQAGAVLTIQELEEVLVTIRSFKEFYSRTPQTTQDALRHDELKQLEYKLTEKILTNR